MEEEVILKPKLNSTVSVVKIHERVLEFFKTNTRSHIRIKVEDDSIMDIILKFDGTKTIEELSEECKVDFEDLKALINFLTKNGILDTSLPHSDFEAYNKYRRVIHFIQDYADSHLQLVEMWKSVRESNVLIIGLGAVGTWVACNLAQSGVKKFILMDADVVDETNLHRQFGFNSDNIGERKIDVIEKRLKEYDCEVNVIKSFSFLENNLNQFNGEKIDLIINCADKPNVDTTSLWVGEYAMKRNIPHIIGGGYNLHLSLVGQTVMPGKSACVKCFEKKLTEDNKIDTEKVKKLAVKNRKIGSFAPMCSIIASMIGMEAVKILTKNIEPSNVNRRGEFDIYNMSIAYREFNRRDDCEWCGKEGKYYNKQSE